MINKNGFKVLSNDLAKDHFFVWNIENILSGGSYIIGVSTYPNIDSASFESISSDIPRLAKDRFSFIRILGPKSIRFSAPSVDATYLGYSYFRDGDRIYGYDTSYSFFREILELRGKNIKPISRDYIWADNKIYRRTYIVSPFANVFKEIEGVDPDSFKLLENKFNSNIDRNNLYTLDKNNVYYKGQIIIDADPQTFKTIAWGNLNYNNQDDVQCSHSLSKDKNNVYYNGKKLYKSNPENFKIFSEPENPNCFNGIYMSDGVSVYYNDKNLDKADSSSFRFITGPYARDSKFFYEAGNIISSNPDETEKLFRDEGRFKIEPIHAHNIQFNAKLWI